MIENKYFEFQVQNKTYLYDIECGNIIAADNVSREINLLYLTIRGKSQI